MKGKDGDYLNGKLDKKVWLLWAELRVNGDVDAIETPTGLIPIYQDLAKLFKDNLDIDYTQADYVQQFTIRIPENLAKLDRLNGIYEKISDTPKIVLDTFADIRTRLEQVRNKHGDYISPFDLTAE